MGRPPPGRDDDIWDDRLAVSMRELQKDTWQKLDTFKAQLKLVLEEVEKQVFEKGEGLELHPGLRLESPDGLHLLGGPQHRQDSPQATHCVRGHRVDGPVRWDA